MEETAGAPSSFAALSPRRLRASSRDGGGVVNRPPSPLTMLLSRHTRRRDVLVSLAGASAWPLRASAIAGSFSARAQEVQKRWRIGFMRVGPPPAGFIDGFRQGMSDLGFVEGRHFVIEFALKHSAAQMADAAA